MVRKVQHTVPVNADVSSLGSSDLDLGTTTNDNSPVGAPGEFLTATLATGSAVALATGVGKDVVTLPLTAGDWDVSWTCQHKPAATTSVTALKSSLSLTLDTPGTQVGGGGIGTDGLVVTNMPATVPAADVSQTGGPVRVSLAATATLRLVAQDTFTVSTMGAFGTLRARRAR